MLKMETELGSTGEIDIVQEPIALHVLVVGFHHKKGMQVEYAFPPVEGGGNSCELPDKWKHLPSLCLPDGAHNHEADTVYFHLPHLTNDDQTVFGVSCYRQIDAEKVANKTADITRNTVQKSVCVLTTLPIYGYVQERLKATTKVYFKGADFSDVRDLEGLYHDLNNTNWRDRLMHGICVSEAVRIFGRNILVLFKLLLLERKVLFYNGEVATLGKIITSLLALLPANLPQGLTQAAATNNECEIPPVEEISGEIESIPIENMEEVEVAEEQKESNLLTEGPFSEVGVETSKIINVTQDEGFRIAETATEAIASDEERRSSFSSLTSVTSRGSMMSPFQFLPSPTSAEANGSASGATSTNLSNKIYNIKGRLSGALNYWTGKEKNSTEKPPSATTTPNPSPSEPEDPSDPLTAPSVPVAEADIYVDHKVESHQPAINAEVYALLESEQCGLPLQIFTKGNLLLPYLSLQYLDVLTAATTRAFVVGASNALFIHKKNLSDVVIHLEDGKIELLDPDLKKQLNLSTEDLRFAENLVRQVDAVNASSAIESPLADVFLDGVGWMGGEEWLRLQFKIYLLAMLRSSMCPDVSREYEIFNSSFMSAWKETHNYRMWLGGGPYEQLMDLDPGHPNAGTISMTDMRIRLSHSIGLDRSRRINQTLANTGTAVVKTKEAVGGAITSAKGAITNFWSSFTTGEKEVNATVEEAVEATPENETAKEDAIIEKELLDESPTTINEIELSAID